MPYGTVNADLITTSDGVSSAGLYGFKNRLINGSFSIAQRATSATITAGSTIAAGYSTVDRWYVYCTGANVTAAQVAGVAPELHQLQITGASSVTAIGVGQRIEAANSADLAGTTCTLSANISNSLLTTVTWTAYYANTADTFGTLASPTRTQIATGTFTVTSTNTRYSANIAIPSAATTGIEIVFTVGAQTSGTWKLDNIQLEEGATATSYDARSIGTEFALAQRYYCQGNFVSLHPQATTTFGTTARNTLYITPPRTTPSCTTSGTNVTSLTVTPYLDTSGTCVLYFAGTASGSATISAWTASAEL